MCFNMKQSVRTFHFSNICQNFLHSLEKSSFPVFLEFRLLQGTAKQNVLQVYFMFSGRNIKRIHTDHKTETSIFFFQSVQPSICQISCSKSPSFQGNSFSSLIRSVACGYQRGSDNHECIQHIAHYFRF